jgi:hypothetical protein
MKMRSDSPFAGLSELDRMLILDAAEGSKIQEVVEYVEKTFPTLEFSLPALKRFIRRLREENLREEVEESDEAMASFAAAGKAGRARDGVIEAMRRKMYAGALDSSSGEKTKELYELMKEEQKEDRLLALQERRMSLEEENAKQEWRQAELEDARSALKLLPVVAEILNSVEGTAEERLARAREVLGARGARLLTEKLDV